MLIVDQLKKSDPHLQVLSLAVLAGMLILVGGLWYHQLIAANRYRADLQDQSFRTVRVPAFRGKILDRNGIPLAENRPSYNVNLYLEDLRRDFQQEFVRSVKPEFTNANPGTRITTRVSQQLQREARYRVVSNLLFQVSSKIDQPRILREPEFNRLYIEERYMPLLLLKDLSFEQAARYLETASPFPSLELDVQPVRHYPFQSTAAHLLGYLQLDHQPIDHEEIAFKFRLPDFKGVAGLEFALDQQLRGKAGVKLVLVNNLAYRQSEEMWHQPQPGMNAVLTLDVGIQQAAERALAAVRPNVRGAAVVMDCQTGDLLALASAPSFDPNLFMGRLSPETWQQLNDETLLPLFNRALRGAYPPGSIFKIVVGLACLEAGVLNPHALFRSSGFFRVGRRTWDDTAGPGEFNFRKAFAFSSNPYFQHYGLMAGPKRIIDMARQFGLGATTGFSVGSESAGYLPDSDKLLKRDGGRWMDGDTANLAIGQGEITVTPLQMAVLTAAVANGGKLLQPRILMRLEPQESPSPNNTIHFPEAQLQGRVNVRPEHLALVRQAMLDDVEFRDPATGRWASGRAAAVKGWQVSGKTGTAEIRGALGPKVTWFVSFAPFVHPRYAVVVVVESGDSGGTTCAPVARQIFEALQKRENRNRGVLASQNGFNGARQGGLHDAVEGTH